VRAVGSGDVRSGSYKFDVQCGHRLAAAGIDVAHHAQSFIAGAAAGAGFG